MSFERPFEGIKVVDLSQGIAGPYCGMLLAQHGADVIKVEPLHGDWARVLGPAPANHTEFSFIGSLGKRSLAIDLKCDEARTIIDALVADADVFMEGFRPGVIDRLGFGHERMMALNPGLIYSSISGFGQTGPLRDKPAMDPVLQAFTGFMLDNKGEDGIPHRANTIINDMSTALYGFQAIAPALYAKRDDGRGRFIDVSLMRGAANLSAIRLMSASQGPLDRTPRTAPSGIFRTGEGWLQLVILQDKDFLTLCDLLSLDDLAKDKSLLGNENRLAQVDMLLDRVETVLLTKPATHWRDLFTEAGLQNEMLQDFQEFLAHPQVTETELFSWLNVDGQDSPWPIPNPPGLPKIEAGTASAMSPVTGQHSNEVLGQLGYDPDAIADLHERKVITTWTASA
ncbi:MAG: CoA transferase [Rhodospirillaceae bacterium]|jgi:crotonobetainyl-CoA:carnitine CoA-transferase CaiB-like acyl-CoA transferase|nr:CoA transferase [Rhodospirillaceae bacterium]MBT4042534.1 CoA transferase [Rhodospirillaceae bacterium]MBT4691161.1 CoA transferase [Rhodospirillaceae bacterium]MBT5080886.1 CoA transferase [Rhodospirillaceae bacterium]MBT5525307.1 CoA transferase [Rhodospirillaceae bacterium]